MTPLTCSYCDEPSVASTTVQSGDAPKNPKHAGTQADLRKVTVIRVCEDHRSLLPDGALRAD
jgi:hypothetical protein